MRKKRKNMSKEQARAEIEFLTECIHEAHTFLQKWKEYIGHRSEEAEDAFVGVTEMEIELRERRKYLAHAITEDVVPF